MFFCMHKYLANLPKDKLKEMVQFGPPDIPVENKTVTVVYGPDMVNISFINFVSNSEGVAKIWTDSLLKIATNVLALNASPMQNLKKVYAKLIVKDLTKEGKLPVKNVIKLFSTSKEERKRVEAALATCSLPTGKNDVINVEKFFFEDFITIVRKVCPRPELDKVFAEVGTKKPYLTMEQVVDFLNKGQRDPRLNEILYPYANNKKALDIISRYEPNKSYANKGHLSVDGLYRYLMSDENTMVDPVKFDLSDDMTQSLSHYFINSSHNTYLTGGTVCCSSLIWMSMCGAGLLDGNDNEPIITHGYTMCTDVLFKDVVEAIAESAFKTSDWPIILSFENHCSPKQQAKMAMHCRTTFGDMLLVEDIYGYPLSAGTPLPSPKDLLGKILIKNKKKIKKRAAPGEIKDKDIVENGNKDMQENGLDDESGVDESLAEEKAAEDSGEKGAGDNTNIVPEEERRGSATIPAPASATTTASPGIEKMNSVSADQPEADEYGDDSESEEEEEEDEEKKKRRQEQKRDKGTAGQETDAVAEMSALVNYIQPVHFHSFEISEKRNRSFEISSFVETAALASLKEFPVEFVNYNKRQLSRIYPRGTRMDSSNYIPQVFWNAGCQLVALNFQTLDLGMQLNMGFFEYNNRSGYILKPDFMRRTDRHFDPFAESTVDGIVAGTVTVKVISGQFLTDKKVGTYVEVDMYGLPADTVRKRFRTKVVPANGINPIYDEEPFVFKKVVLPHLAVLRISVSEENGKFIGHRILPVEGLRPGYRHVVLRNEANQPLNLPTVFVHITVKDFIPDSFEDFANALANPIAYQAMIEKRAQQLEALMEDDDISTTEEDGRPKMTPGEKTSGTPVQRSLSSGSTNMEQLSSTANARKGSSPNTANIHSAVSRVASSTSVEPSAVQIEKGRKSLTSGVLTPSLSIDQTINKSLSSPEGEKEPPAEIFKPLTIQELKQLKTFKKLQDKQQKELAALSKKQEKIRGMLRKSQTLKEDKLLTLQAKDRLALEKCHAKALKKANKAQAGAVEEEVKRKSSAEMEKFLKDYEQQLVDLRQAHYQAGLSTWKEHCLQEKELKMKHTGLMYVTLHQQMTNSQQTQMGKVKEIHDKEVKDLKQRLDQQRKEEERALAKRCKDRNELARLKRETQQKHIQVAVQHRQQLDEIHSNRTEELQKNHKEIEEAISKEEEKANAEIMVEYEKKSKDLPETWRALQEEKDAASSSINGPSTPTGTSL
ncbi:1-phosphatidylinositol 4,5-bisphosphate phosphodiesterase beta-1-like [Branchiostoma floridae]|uniref:1-phosphatidylinositol 4,5-bisphosphate phosphodiesterase n=1 Tax=Branchiostoma floridae TaxID=7739 RepID=A0A9J7LW94_BRAFL|nr:1-phosphatidylinositol 4,5-bisphosphate phosphodiesterase beta-1-like [Branchiostoma floridae]